MSFIEGCIIKTSRLVNKSDTTENLKWVSVCLDPKKGMKGAHAYSNAPNTSSKEVIKAASDGTLSPESLVRDQTESWYWKWCGTPEVVSTFTLLLDTLRNQSLQEDFNPKVWETYFATTCIISVANQCRDNSSSDQMAPSFIAGLPDFILKELQVLFVSWVKLASIPFSSFQLFLVLLPKKLGGLRTIGTYPSLFLLFLWDVWPPSLDSGTRIMLNQGILLGLVLKPNSNFIGDKFK